MIETVISPCTRPPRRPESHLDSMSLPPPESPASPRVLPNLVASEPAASVRGGEVVRKTLHMLPGLLPFALSQVPHPDPLDAISIGVVAAICGVLTAVFLACHRVVRRPREDNFLSTTLSYPACVLLTLVVFPANVEFTCVVVVVLAFGDASAYIGGKLLRGPALPWNPQKTWAGTISFVAVAAPLAALAYWGEARNPAVPFAMALTCGATAALAGALAESLPTRITDNLRVGIAAAVAVAAVHFLTIRWFV